MKVQRQYNRAQQFGEQSGQPGPLLIMHYFFRLLGHEIDENTLIYLREDNDARETRLRIVHDFGMEEEYAFCCDGSVMSMEAHSAGADWN